MILAICGGTASGKTTLEHELLKRADFTRLISTTTRAARPNEVNGREYNFETVDNFERMLANDAFIETNEVAGHYYGKTKGALTTALGRAKHVVSVIEPVGMRNLRLFARQYKLPFASLYLHVDPKVQAQRFVERYADASKQVMALRLGAMLDEELDWNPARPGAPRWQYDLNLDASASTPQQLAEVVTAYLGA